jgi:uncharacterized membrane protein YhaH (DUF805 family)
MNNIDQPTIGSGEVPSGHGGMKRSHYLIFLVSFFLLFSSIIIFRALDAPTDGGMYVAQVVVMFAALIALFVLSTVRLKNIGYSKWWVLTLFVPCLNIFVSVACAAYPDGYKSHGKLDATAYIVAAIMLSLIVYGSIP